MLWAYAVVGIFAVMASLGVAAMVRRRRVAVAPLVEVRVGAFDELAARRLPPAESALAVVQDETQALHQVGATRQLPGSPANVDFHGAGAVVWGAALADGVIPALGVWERWSSVDEHVFQAFSHLAREQVDGMADLLRVVHAKEYAIESAGFARKLLGHVGEWHAQEHLMDAGVAVAMPAASNVPGLDLWADGHAMNVKTVKDAASAAYSHFAEYPDIPILVPADATNIPADALHFDPSAGFDAAALAGSDHLVVVDDALSHADVLDQTNHALDVAGDPGPHLHFPWVTAAVSGFREARLLVKGHTDLSRAAKNVAVDTAAVGGGGAIGAKTGAAIGTFIAPGVGTVVGGIVGGLVGAMGGRAVANEVKRAPLEVAKTQYDTALQSYRAVEATLVEDAGTQWEQAREEERRALQALLGRMKHDFERDIVVLQQKLGHAVRLEQAAAAVIIDGARERLGSEVDADRAALHARVPFLLRVWSGLVAPEEAQRYAQHRAEFSAWSRAADQLLATWTGTDADTSKCFDLIVAAPGGIAAAEAHVLRAESARRSIVAQTANRHQELLARAIISRRDAIARLESRWEKIRTSIEGALSPAISSLQAASEELRRELQRNGIQA